MTNAIVRLAASVALAASFSASAAESATFSIKALTPESAMKAATAALAKCRADGYQVAVAIVDRSGLVQAVLRDRFAGAHTPETATNKAWTAVSFRTHTSDLVKLTAPGQEAAGIRNLPRVVAVGGGVMIEAGGSILAGIGVSGAPGGAADEVCARAGIKAIADSLEF
ncbi:MAG: heme-binding protein [Betaproteobacteria bacterium]|nr:heme-binding protein [Betaproteobacteria bacterium]